MVESSARSLQTAPFFAPRLPVPGPGRSFGGHMLDKL
jgi:hypothetical protein